MRKFAKLLMSVILICSFVFGCFVTSAEITNFDIKCPDYSFTLLDGTTVTNTTNANKTTVLVFFLKNSENSLNLIKGLANANWVDSSKISIIAVEFGEATNTVLQNISNDCGGKNVAFSSCNYSVSNNFFNTVGINNTKLPIVFVVDGANTIRSYSTDTIGISDLRRTLSKYVDGLTPEPASNIKIKGTFDYSKAFDVLDIVNSQRAANGLSALKMDSVLLDAAMQRAAECSVYYSHTRPDGTDGMTVIDTNIFRENIAPGYASPTDVMDGWMSSEGHKNNILNADCDSIGIGVFWHNGVYFWTQIFSNQLGPEETTERPNETPLIPLTVLDSYFTFEVSQNSLKLEKDKTENIYACIKQLKFTHSNELDHECVSYTSSNTNVATVSDDGKVTAIGKGNATITVSLKNSPKSTTVAVEVTLPVNNDNTQNTPGKDENTPSNPSDTDSNSENSGSGKPDTGTTSQESTDNPDSSQESNTGVTSKPSNTDDKKPSDKDENSSEDESTNELQVIFESEDATVKGAENVFEKDTVIEVNKLDGATPPTALTDIAQKYVMYDILAMNNNVSVQPNGKLFVTFNIPTNFDSKKISLVAIDDNNPVKETPFVVDETLKTVTAELENLGKYAIIEIKETGTENIVTIPDTNTNNEPPVENKNNVALIIITVAIVMLLSGGGLTVWYFLYYKKKNAIETDEIAEDSEDIE